MSADLEHISVSLPEFHRQLTKARAAAGIEGRGAMSLDRLRHHADTDASFPRPLNGTPGERITRLYRLTELRAWMRGSTEVAA